MGLQLLAIWYSMKFRFTDSNRDRGDVPGWVLVTLMTAGIVTALWVVAEPELRNLLKHALNITGDPNK